MNIENNSVKCVDNLKYMNSIKDSVIKLIYLDPPFFTQQIRKNKNETYSDIWKNLEEYLRYIKQRIQECFRILSNDGCIYIHCDEKADSYIRIICDEIFGYKNLKRKIIWNTSPINQAGFKTRANNWIRGADTILYYVKDVKNYCFNKLFINIKHPKKYSLIKLSKDYNPIGGVWNDILSFNYVTIASNESVGYPTQKPFKLMERIILASSIENDIVLDPFCGSGSFVVKAKQLNRNYFGCDINENAIKITTKRLEEVKIEPYQFINQVSIVRFFK